MKAKNLYTAIALCAGSFAIALPASAQDVFVDEATTVTEFTCDNTNRYFSDWRNNWFIEIGAGINQPLVEHSKHTGPIVDRKKMTATYTFGFGHWFSPYLAFRIKASGGSLHWNYGGFTHAKHVNLQAELMWDMCNSIAGVNPDRVVSFIPFVGLGGDAMWDYKLGNGQKPFGNIVRKNGRHKSVQWTLPVSVGFQLRFRLCKYVDFFAEARAAFYGDNWNNIAMGRSIDGLYSFTGGFNFNIGGRQFGNYNQCAYVSQIAALNGQVNDLRAQLLACGQEVANLSAQLPCPEVKNATATVATPLLTTVRFKINSDVITPEEEVNIYNMAQYLKANPDQKVVICGYADKDTGTSEYNMALSKRRAEAVADALVNNYGVSRDRLTVNYDGSDVQPYPENNWNRIVIFSQK